MDKKDILYGIIALAIILVIALVVKPLATGHPVNMGIPVPTTPVPQSTQAVPLQNYSQVRQVVVFSTTVPTPTPVPTWNSTVVQGNFVSPSTYGVTFNQSISHGTRVPSIPQNSSMITYANISGQLSGTSSIMYIPFPYWELWYTVDPYPDQTPPTIKIVPTMGVGISYSGISGSYSTLNPQFTIQVMDGNDPNRIVRTISPPGGINLDLWTGVYKKPQAVSTAPAAIWTPVVQTNIKYQTQPTPPPAYDPRPWVEKFFEGQRDYYFIITAQSLQSYSIQIRVPTSYIGKY